MRTRTRETTPTAAPEPLSEQDRCLLNWLSTRIGEDGCLLPDHQHEAALITARLARAKALGLPVVAGAYIPRPAGGASTIAPRTHTVECLRCAVTCRESHYHCCLCQRVFRTAHSYEVHTAGVCVTDAQLGRRNLVLVDGVWRGKSLGAEATAQLKAKTAVMSAPALKSDGATG